MSGRRIGPWRGIARGAHLVRVAAFLVAALGALACNKKKELPTVQSTLADTADQVMWHIKTVLTDRGMLRAEVMSDTGYFFDDNSRIELRGVTVDFYTTTGQKSARLTSLEGTYNTRLNQTEARKHVVVNTTDGKRLTTPQLRYDQARNLVSSDSAFVLDQPGKHLEGIGFVSDPDMKNIQVKKVTSGTRGTFTLPGT